MCASPAISSGVVDMQTAAVAWLRTARHRMPLPRGGCAECRAHTAPLSACAAGPAPLGTCTLPAPHRWGHAFVGDMHAAGPSPLGTCIRWGHAFDSLPPSSHVAPSPHPNHRPEAFRRSRLRFLSGSGDAGPLAGGSATTLAGGGAGGQEQEPLHGGPPVRRPGRDPPEALRAGRGQDARSPGGASAIAACIVPRGRVPQKVHDDSSFIGSH